ncbi:MAG: hypothetical protein KJI71_03965 [Patescibacteria group bacterium]|nr:hypothetical protein [Patescibacteria group bacterium]
MKKKIFLEEELYRRISINDLIIFAMNSTIDSKKGYKFETLVNKCFTLFPKVFSLSGYPKLPDSRKLDRPLRTLRKKGIIKGNPKTLFALTKAGKKRALEVTKAFRQGKLL